MGYPELCSINGSGKLLCYSILPRVFNLHAEECSIVIVISPLVAFILDTF